MLENQAFVWGTATAATQVEGAAREGGKGASIWDAFAQIPGRILNGDTPEVACDQYHLYETDVKLMRELGVNAYRFSFSWPRIMPDGKDRFSPEGLAYYDRLIDCLLANGIEPWVTLYHWDLPLALQLENDGWLSRRTAEYFAAYARGCFEHFKGRVKHWITLNEPWCSAVLGHGQGVFAPGRSDADEPYRAAHNLLLAHGLAVREFRNGGYDGVIGISNNCDWREPLTEKEEDRAAAQEALEFFYGWFTDPVVFGRYPDIMRRRVGARLPEFTLEEQKFMAGSVDFLGLNHYTTLYASREPSPDSPDIGAFGNGGLADDQQVVLSVDPAWQRTANDWNVVPWGFRNLLNWIAGRYPDYPIYVSENGCADLNVPKEKAVDDGFRGDFLKLYTDALFEAKYRDGVPVNGYFCWSFIDNFEWASGYKYRFGLVYCDYQTLERTPKKSFEMYRNIIQQNRS